METAAEALRKFAAQLRHATSNAGQTRANPAWKSGLLDGFNVAAECADEMADVYDGKITIDAAPDAVLSRVTLLHPMQDAQRP